MTLDCKGQCGWDSGVTDEDEGRRKPAHVFIPRRQLSVLKLCSPPEDRSVSHTGLGLSQEYARGSDRRRAALSPLRGPSSQTTWPGCHAAAACWFGLRNSLRRGDLDKNTQLTAQVLLWGLPF